VKRRGLARFDFTSGSLTLTEAGTKKRASLRLVRGEDVLARLDPGGLEVLDADLESFARALRVENHTLKRSLTDPHLFSGIGNAYSDEILHRAKLSPVKWTSRLSDEEVERLYAATGDTLREWTEQLRAEQEGGFPTKVTAFRPQMAVHGRYGKACPDCGGPVQRIRYADNETNYCPPCQTEGKLLADRGLSRLLKGDWPKSLEELEERKSQRRL
jgi:formamidopyrimidine-DNA glycosylase